MFYISVLYQQLLIMHVFTHLLLYKFVL